MRLKTIALGLLCLIAPFQSVNALDPGKAPTQYVHSVWQAEDGLPQNWVTAIIETSDGYLWVGTQTGLARFDGVRFTVFDHSNTPSLHDDWIADLAEDTQGTLWIATSNGGVTSFRDGVFSHLDTIAERGGLTVVAATDGSVWIGGYGGVKQVKNGRMINAYAAADLAGDPVTKLAVDKDGPLWIATPYGLSRLAGGKIRNYSIKDGLPSNNVIGLYVAADEALLVQTNDAGIARRVNGRFERWFVQGVSPAVPINDMLRDRDGSLWLASASEGLIRVSGQQVSRFTTKEGLSSNAVLRIHEDEGGSLWVGTAGGGLDRLKDGRFTTYAKEEGLAADMAYSVLEDSAGDVWVATLAGLSRLRGNDVRVFTTADGLRANDPLALWEDHEQNLWVGSATSGLDRVVRGRTAPGLSTRDGIPAAPIGGILEDRAHQLWIATQRAGLVHYVKGRTSVYSRENGLLTDVVFGLAEGADGTLWVGTSDGLNSIKDGQVKHHVPNGLSHAVVTSLHLDASKTLWIGTLGRGLFRLDDGRFTRYTTAQGLPNDTINSIVADAAGDLWLGLNKGVARVNRHDLNAVAAGTRKTLQATVFGKADGMKSAETNGLVLPAAWRARDGRLWFPTTRGVVVVDPSRVALNSRQPLARVEQLIADEVPIALAAPAQLVPGTRRLELRYTAPSLSAPERTRFRYRLDGFDEQWVPGGTQRVAHYTNLPPGRYSFHVSASAENGQWGGKEGRFDFELRPQYYQTWWFHLLLVLAGLGLAWAAYRLRVNWLHARAAVLEERQRIASDIHDSLAQGLSGIIFQGEAALRRMTPGIALTRVNTMVELALISLDEARYSVWNLSPPVQDQKGLVESLSSMAQQFTRGRVGRLDIHTSGTAWRTRPEANHHIVLIAQEAVSNAIQHGHARTITIKLSYMADGLHLSVSDDGLGFDQNASAQERGRGYGMRNMHHRAERLGGILNVTSDTDKGTQIFLRIPRLGRLTKLWQRLHGKGIARIDG